MNYNDYRVIASDHSRQLKKKKTIINNNKQNMLEVKWEVPCVVRLRTLVSLCGL